MSFVLGRDNPVQMLHLPAEAGRPLRATSGDDLRLSCAMEPGMDNSALA
jgi:hypothetical protein